ncbi:hypothetical protein BRC93_06330 [Halobacteriales archaeon QS_5_70_15]|nr:MAG: hypothetical protein BRC93_06330 [Halobacteriales archaeon QS_5_70_15]
MNEPARDGTTDAPGTPDTDGEAYGGVLGAFPYAFRASDSVLFRLYVLIGGLLAVLATVVFGIALIVQVAGTLGGPGGTFTFSRTLFVLLGLFVVAPLVAPVLLVARRHRRTGSDTRYDTLLAAAGMLFVVSLYLGLVASIPPEFTLDGEVQVRPPATGPLAPLVRLLYAVPSVASPVVPLLGATLVPLAHRYAD